MLLCTHISNLNFRDTYLLEFILAENGFDEIFSSIGRFTDGMGMLLIPLS